MHALQNLLDHYRETSQSEREKDTYFEELFVQYLRNSRYPLELFQRVITVNLETMKIVRNLPKLDI